MLPKLTKAVVAGLLLILMTWGFVEWRSSRIEDRLTQRFSTLADGMSIEDRYPLQTDNESVEDLNRIGAALGIQMVINPESSDPVPTQEAAERWEEHHTEITEYLLQVRNQADDGELPDAPTLTAYLEEEAAHVDQLRLLLLEQDPPIWSMDLSKGFATAIPNYLGMRRLHRLLAFAALQALEDGNTETFLEFLESCWRLNEAISEHPYLIAKLMSLALLNEQVPLLARIPRPSPLWRERVQELSPFDDLSLGLHMEAWVAYASARAGDTDFFSGRELPAIAKSYLRWCLNDYAERMVAWVDSLPRASIVDFDSDKALEDHLGNFPLWNVVGKMLVPNFYTAWLKAARAELAVDLVEKTFEARAAIQSGEMQDLSTSQDSVLTDFSWNLEVEDDSVSIALDGDLDAQGKNPLPLRYRLHTRTEDSHEN